jgi:putative flippase GtrA
VARPRNRTRLLRFFIVGAGAVLLMFVLSYLFAMAGLRPFAGSVLAYALVFVLAYTAQRSWTFGGEHRHRSALPRYLVLQAGCALASGALAHVAVTGFKLSPFPMAVLTALAAGAASYVVSSAWVFPQRA